MRTKGSVAGRGRRGGKNSRERQGSVLTLRGEAGYGRFRDVREAP